MNIIMAISRVCLQYGNLEMRSIIRFFITILGIFIVGCDNQHIDRATLLYNNSFIKKWKIAEKQLRELNPKWNGKFEILKDDRTQKIIGLDLTNRIETKQAISFVVLVNAALERLKKIPHLGKPSKANDFCFRILFSSVISE